MENLKQDGNFSSSKVSSLVVVVVMVVGGEGGGWGGRNPRNVCEGDNEERAYTKLNPAQFPMHFLLQ